MAAITSSLVNFVRSVPSYAMERVLTSYLMKELSRMLYN